LAAEGIGTAFLLAIVIGSGVMGERLAGGNVAIALLANSLATGAALVALILTFGPISGAHFNPVVSLADASQGGLSVRELSAYVPAQLIGAFAGVAGADVMFGEPVLPGPRMRAGLAWRFSERSRRLVSWSSFWLARNGGRTRCRSYWRVHHRGVLVHVLDVTANPADACAMATNTFAGIRPRDVPVFLPRRPPAPSPRRSCSTGSRPTGRDRLDHHPPSEVIHGSLRPLPLHRQLSPEHHGEALLNLRAQADSGTALEVTRKARCIRWRRRARAESSAGGTARSKGWDEFAAPGAPRLDFVFTVATERPRKSSGSGPASR
jgi:hypothetical protein